MLQVSGRLWVWRWRCVSLHARGEERLQERADDELKRVLQQQRRAKQREVGAAGEEDAQQRQP